MKTPEMRSNWHLGVTCLSAVLTLLKVDRGTPTIVPAHLFGFFQFASIAFGGAALLDAQCRFSGQTSLNIGFFSQSNAFRGFFVQSLCNGGGAALVAQGQYLQSACDVALTGADHVSGFKLSGGFGRLAIDFDPAFANFICGQRAGLVKARSPKPFVDSDFVHKSPFWAEIAGRWLFLYPVLLEKGGLGRLPMVIIPRLCQVKPQLGNELAKIARSS